MLLELRRCILLLLVARGRGREVDEWSIVDKVNM